MKFTYLLSLLLNVSSYLSEGCYNPYERKEIRDLTPQEFDRFVRATKILQKTPSEIEGLSIYDSFTKLHNENEQFAHGTGAFLPWHRYFIRRYEMELQKIDKRVHLPYWDWTKDYKHPETSIVLTNEYMGGNGDYYKNHTVRTGRFANLNLSYPQPHLLQRKFNDGNKLKNFTDPYTINAYLNFEQYSNFCYNFEKMHGKPHIYIGGEGFDFYEMWSPNDPIFMLHHTFIDSIWYEWQQRHQDGVQYDGESYNKNLHPSDSLVTWPDIQVQSTFDTLDEFYCYTYPRYEPRIIPDDYSYNEDEYDGGEYGHKRPKYKQQHNKKDRDDNDNNVSNGLQSFLSDINNLDRDQVIEALSSNLPNLIPNFQSPLQDNQGNIQYSEPIPEKWLKMNNFDVEQVRQSERKDNLFLQLLNSIPGINI